MVLFVMVFLRRRHRATLEAIFSRPTRANIRWDNVESLLLACGAHIEERAGSRVAVYLNGVATVFHRPHPRPEATKNLIDDVRAFLIEAGVRP